MTLTQTIGKHTPSKEKFSLKKKFFNNDNSPPEIFNKTLYISVFVFGILGCARGYDEGNISGSVAQTSFIKEFGLKDPSKTSSQLANLKSNITSMVQLGSIGGCLIAMYLVDKLGRIRTLQVVCIGWIVSGIIQITSKSVGQLYAGRLIEGLFIGQTTVIGPTYLSEVSPKSIRGLCNCVFAGAVYFGVMIAYFANYGTALHVSSSSAKQWIMPTSVKIILGGLLFIGSWLCNESPRWLVKVGKIEKAFKNLSKIRNLDENHPYIISEISDIQEQLIEEREETGKKSRVDLLKELFLVKSIRYRLFVGIAAQILGQWSGANAVTIYMPELTAMVGYKGTKKLLMTAVLGVVKFFSAYMCAFFLIDYIGRRRSLYTGITIQFFSTLYFATYLAIVPEATSDDFDPTPSQRRAGTGALAMLYLNGVGWTMGWNSIQYLINSEMFPLRIRNFAVALIMTFHFANQYGNSKATPTMLLQMTSYGCFYFFAGVLILGLFWCWFFLPEISGRSLESMEELFNLPWYLIGRRGAELCPDVSGINNVHVNDTGSISIKQEAQYIENISQDGKSVRSVGRDGDGHNGVLMKNNATSDHKGTTASSSSDDIMNVDLEKQ